VVSANGVRYPLKLRSSGACAALDEPQRRLDRLGRPRVLLRVEERLAILQHRPRLGDPLGRRQRIPARLPERQVGALLDVRQSALPLQLPDPLLDPRAHLAQWRIAQNPVVRLDVGVDRNHLNPIRPQKAREHRDREIGRGRVTSRRINQRNLHEKARINLNLNLRENLW
jgi:hypothetical protein